MDDGLYEIVERYRYFEEPRDGLGDNSFKLACSFTAPASQDCISAARAQVVVPDELARLWAISRQSKLFEDVDYVQWGLILLGPEECVRQTKQVCAERADNYRENDVVIGEFLGDQELLVGTSTEGKLIELRIALPLDDRSDWEVAASGLTGFLDNYLRALGGKYWE